MDVELDYEEMHWITCPHCGKRSRHVIKGVATGEIEPPEREEDG